MARPPSDLSAIQGSELLPKPGNAETSSEVGEPFMLTGGDFAGRDMTHFPINDATLTKAIVAAWNHELATALPGLDQLYSASEELAEQVTAHAVAVEHRGDEIDALLDQIRASMSAARVK